MTRGFTGRFQRGFQGLQEVFRGFRGFLGVSRAMVLASSTSANCLLGQYHYSHFGSRLKNGTLFLRVSNFVCVCLCFRCLFVRRHVMPRRGWQQSGVFSGWVRVLSGPSRHQRSGQLLTVQVPWAVGVQDSPSPPLRSMPVLLTRSSSRAARQVAVSEAVGEVKKLEAGIASGRTVSTPRVSTKLWIARPRSKLPPVAELVESFQAGFKT